MRGSIRWCLLVGGLVASAMVADFFRSAGRERNVVRAEMSPLFYFGEELGRRTFVMACLKWMFPNSFVANIRSLGVGSNHSVPGIGDRLEATAGAFPEIRVVSINDRQQLDVMAALRMFPNLESVVIDGDLSEKGVALLAACPRVTTVELTYGRIVSDERSNEGPKIRFGLWNSFQAMPQLRVLRAFPLAVSNKSLWTLATLKQLKELEWSVIHDDEGDLAALEDCGHLERLVLHTTAADTLPGVLQYGKALNEVIVERQGLETIVRKGSVVGTSPAVVRSVR